MKYLIDLHVHTVASGHAFSTIEEIADRVQKKGVKGFAVTDHGPSAPGAPHRYYFSNIKVVPKYIDGVRVFKGIEANILDESGRLDLEDFDLAKLEIILAGFHKNTGYENSGFEKNTRALINAIDNGWIDILSHLGNPDYPFDHERAVKAAKENNVAIEINNSSFTVSRKGSKKNCYDIITMAKKYDCLISLGSDAHISFDACNLEMAENMLEEIGYDEKLILNTDIEKIEKFLESRRKGR